MQTIGHIDLEKFSCIASDITTDEVIITEERIKHIRDRHPGDYEQFSIYLAEIIANPDYILQDERPSTAMVLKEFAAVNGIHFRLTLRLAVQQDGNDRKNSILTFMKIRKKEYHRLLRNKIILYKRE